MSSGTARTPNKNSPEQHHQPPHGKPMRGFFVSITSIPSTITTQYRTPRQSVRHTHRIAQDAPRIDDHTQMGVESSPHEIVRCGSYCVC
jgi:hypothetical protein